MTLEILSGRPDPHWTIESSHQNYTKIKSLLNSATTYSPEEAPSKLGYQGFTVEKMRNGEGQGKKLVVGPESEKLQMLLLWSRPPNAKAAPINSIAEEEIRSGTVRPNVTNAAKRFAPWYRPSYWNGEAHVTRNNCYNYASTVRTNTFAQPGRGSGNPIDWFSDVTPADVRSAAESDGCVFEPAKTHMCAPKGNKHLGALMVYIGKCMH